MATDSEAHESIVQFEGVANIYADFQRKSSHFDRELRQTSRKSTFRHFTIHERMHFGHDLR